MVVIKKIGQAAIWETEEAMRENMEGFQWSDVILFTFTILTCLLFGGTGTGDKLRGFVVLYLDGRCREAWTW